MDIANRREAFLEASLDIQEGADILMIKPALYYLDVIQQGNSDQSYTLSQNCQTSGGCTISVTQQ